MERDELSGFGEIEVNGKVSVPKALGVIVAVVAIHTSVVLPAIAYVIGNDTTEIVRHEVHQHRVEVQQALEAHEREYERTMLSIRDDIREIRKAVRP